MPINAERFKVRDNITAELITAELITAKLLPNPAVCLLYDIVLSDLLRKIAPM